MHLLTSREDAFPSVVLEAMASGLPTVAFMGAGGAPDLLAAYGAGSAVAAGDAASMAETMLLVAGRVPGLAERTRHDFAWDGYVDRVLALVGPERRRISAVVPNFNYARYLPGRLASIAGQTLRASETLVLDDASTDGSAAVVRGSGGAVRWVANAVNSGSVFRQWRRAAELATEDWLWIAEADDEAEPGLLARLSQALDAAPDAVLAFCDSRAIDAEGRTMWPDHQAYYARGGTQLLQQDAVIPAALFLRSCLAERNMILNASAVLWHRATLLRALDRCQDALSRFRMAGDWRLYAEMLAEGGSVAYVAQPLNIHRRHAASVTKCLPAQRHLAEVTDMHRHMQGVLGHDPALLRRQRHAMTEARAALVPPKPAAAAAILRLPRIRPDKLAPAPSARH